MNETIDAAATLCALTVDGTPHSILSPNDRTDERKKWPYRQALKAAAAVAMHNELIRRPQIAQDAADGRLRLSIRILWERGRKVADNDNALASCKNLVDGIAAILGVDDKHFTFEPVSQLVTDNRQGVVIVFIRHTALVTEAGGVDRDPLRRDEGGGDDA